MLATGLIWLPIGAAAQPATASAATTVPSPAVSSAAAAAPGGTDDGMNGTAGTGSAGAVADNAQAALVDQEDQRIIEIRAALSSVLQIGGQESALWKQPQIFGSANGKTLVLPARSTDAPYTIKDLLRAGGGRYVRQLPDGSYLIGINIFVASGAELLLASGTTSLQIRMAGVPGAFSSIVSFDGTIKIKGTAAAPVHIVSWDPRTERPDTDVTDGRPYIRAIGGRFSMEYARVADLGFWSGRTGGIALTGTDRPVSVFKHRNKAQRHADKLKRLKGRLKNPGSAGGGPGDVQLSPAGGGGSIGRPDGTASHVPVQDLVSGVVSDSTIAGNAYGIFISGSDQPQIVRDKIKDSLVDGVLMHRFAKNANIQDTTVSGSGADGFVLSRATQKVRVTGCVAENNGRNGFTLNGLPLAYGPSASGEPLQSFGDSSVNRSTARNNRRYGIELLGGDRLAVQSSVITGGDMGIVVRAHATRVQLAGNRLSGQKRQGIALRDGVTGANVGGNTIAGTITGIYLRDSAGTLVGNTIHTLLVPRAHGIAVKGQADGTEVDGNTVSGAGTTAVRTSGSQGAVVQTGNDTHGWHDTSTVWMKARRYVKPMNIVWAGVFLLVIVSATRAGNDGRRGRGTAHRRGVHPYALQRRLEERPSRGLRRPRQSAGRPAMAVGAGAGSVVPLGPGTDDMGSNVGSRPV